MCHNADMENVNLTDHFLIAMPNMADSYFTKTLTYICEHNDQGALGVVVNRPLEMTMESLFEQLDIALSDQTLKERWVHFGGPVQMDRGFVLHMPVGHWQPTLAVNGRVGLTTSKDILEAAARAEGPPKLFVTLGYAGWAAGQLEQELAQNAWLSVKASTDILFDVPWEDRLPAAMRQLGVDFSRLSEAAGHA